MAFVNEFVPEEDVKKYGLEEIDRRYRRADLRPQWTVDRERDMYLRLVDIGREEDSNRLEFTFFWKGVLLYVQLKLRGGGVRGGEGWSEWSLHDTPFKAGIAGVSESELKKNYSEIIVDLKAALTAFKEFGLSSTSTKHTATFNF